MILLKCQLSSFISRETILERILRKESKPKRAEGIMRSRPWDFMLNNLFLVLLGLSCCCTGLCLAAASRGCSLVAVLSFLIVVASLVAEHGL